MDRTWSCQPLSPGMDVCCAWSPDGTRIAFTTNRDGNYEICVMNADGSGPRNVTSHGATIMPRGIRMGSGCCLCPIAMAARTCIWARCRTHRAESGPESRGRQPCSVLVRPCTAVPGKRLISGNGTSDRSDRHATGPPGEAIGGARPASSRWHYLAPVGTGWEVVIRRSLVAEMS